MSNTQCLQAGSERVSRCHGGKLLTLKKRGKREVPDEYIYGSSALAAGVIFLFVAKQTTRVTEPRLDLTV